MDGPNRLYHNDGDGTFTDVAAELGVDRADRTASPAGSGTTTTTAGSTSSSTTTRRRSPRSWPTSLGLPVDRASQPRLYRNLGAEGFRDVSREVGLDRPMPADGLNFGDIDNDGFLDLYLGHRLARPTRASSPT